MFYIEGKYACAVVHAETVEPEAISQIHHMINNIAFTNDAIFMPDIHNGSGCCIGFTMKLTKDKIVPNVIGFDIGCSVMSLCLGPDLMDKFISEETPKEIRKLIPFGCVTHSEPIVDFEKLFRWKNVNSMVERVSLIFGQRNIPHISYKWLVGRCKEIGMRLDKFLNSVGTVGGGK